MQLKLKLQSFCVYLTYVHEAAVGINDFNNINREF